MATISTSVVLLLVCAVAARAVDPCPGDTRGDRRCNHDSTHRVCAKIGIAGTSFWRFTGQTSWCNTIGHYGGKYGDEMRCPKERPSWCICKWATARWIKGQGCDDSIQFNCAATDVCNLKMSYLDYNVNLQPAHDCMKVKCKAKWDACPNPPPRPKPTSTTANEEENDEEEAGFQDIGSYHDRV